MIEIDGSQGEGGGQILRSALALSLLTKQPFRLRKIRANRKPKPGLRPQHLACVRAAAQIGHAKCTGDAVGSSQITFEPGEITPGKYRFAIGTAGSTSLVLHTVYLPLSMAKAPSEITLEGGTHNEKAPCYHFLETTWQAYLKRIGLEIALKMDRPGFYPRGGGLVQASIRPCANIRPLLMTQHAQATTATILSGTADLPEQVDKRLSRRAMVKLKDHGVETQVVSERWENGPGCMLAVTLDGQVPSMFFGLGERGKPSEAVADEAVEQALRHRESTMPVDPHSADQLLLPLALADGDSEFHVSEITLHLTTNAMTIGLFLDRKIEIDGEISSPGIVRVAGRKL